MVLRQELIVAVSRLLGRVVATATLAPASAKATAMAWPIELDAPMTRAALSRKENSSRPITPLLSARGRAARNRSAPVHRPSRRPPTPPSRHSCNWPGPKPGTHRADLALRPCPAGPQG